MANKQIKDYTNTALADTDSLIKQSVTGVTGKTTIADLKANIDGRYQGKGKVIWEDEGGSIFIVLSTPLSTSHNYEVYVNVFASKMTAARMVLKGNPSGEPWIAFISYVGSDLYVYGVGSTEVPICIEGVAGHQIYKIIDLGEPI